MYALSAVSFEELTIPQKSTGQETFQSRITMTVTEEADRGTLSVRITNTEKIISWISKIPVSSEDILEQRDVQHSERYFVGAVAFLFAFINLCIALSVTFALVRVRSMRSSFGFLNVSHNIADCLVLTMFVAWFAPMIMIDSNFGHTNFAMRLSQLTGVFMCGSVHSAISIALGRYIALVYPLKYSILFSKRNTIIYAAIAWITGIMQHAPTLFPQCFYYFDFRRYAWIHADTTCGQFLSWFSDLCYGFTMITLVGIPNLATIFQLQRVQKQNDLKSLDANQKRRQVQEWRFFLQAFLTNSLIMLTFIAFHLIKKSMKLRFLHFLTSCLCVILVHGTNSIVLLMCNKELRRWLSQAITRRKLPAGKLFSSAHQPITPKTSSSTRTSEVSAHEIASFVPHRF